MQALLRVYLVKLLITQKIKHDECTSRFDGAVILQATLLGLWLVPPVISVKMQFWRFLVVRLGFFSGRSFCV